MLFNSLDFALFLPIIFILYWLIPGTRIQVRNVLLVIASYVFYGWWDWRFLGLILFSTAVDYTIGILLSRESLHKKRKLLLLASLLVNLGLLGFFKYYNFFIDSFTDAFLLFGQPFEAGRLNIILPVGISFYTFQTLSYTIDVYRRKIEPTHDFIQFMAFVSFFPQLVAGPIERAAHLLPQFRVKHRFNYKESVDGLRQILWGFFKKVVIADNCAEVVNHIFSNHETMSGSLLLTGTILFAIQIYGDFSGYSDIAIGVARLFGFDLMQNFAFPYFSRDIAEFWRRWHISLSTWFRDYLYIPLGGSRVSQMKQLRNVFIIFLVSGFWHGANWTFIFWGFLNALYFIPLMLFNRNRHHLDVVAHDRSFLTIREFVSITSTFMLTTLAWVFFRAESMGQAWEILGKIFSKSLLTVPYYEGIGLSAPILVLIPFFFLVEWMGRRNRHALESFMITTNRPVRWSFYSFLIFLIGMYIPTDINSFIYFQF